MNACTTQWEDSENNRIVEMSVAYRIEGENVTVDAVTPQSVTFVCRETGTPLRRIGVHTEKGRQMLTRAYHERVGIDGIRAEVTRQNMTPAC